MLAKRIPYDATRPIRCLYGWEIRELCGRGPRSVSARYNLSVRIIPERNPNEWDCIGDWSEGKTVRDPYRLRTDSPSVCIDRGFGMVPINPPVYPTNPERVAEFGENNVTKRKPNGTKRNPNRKVDRSLPFPNDSLPNRRTDDSRTEYKRIFRTKTGQEIVRVLVGRADRAWVGTHAKSLDHVRDTILANLTQAKWVVRNVFAYRLHVKRWEGQMDQFVQDVLGAVFGADPFWIRSPKLDPYAPRHFGQGSPHPVPERNPYRIRWEPTKHYPNGRPMITILMAACSAIIRAERKHNIRVRPDVTDPNGSRARSLATVRRDIRVDTCRTISEHSLAEQGISATKLATLTDRQLQVWSLLQQGKTGRTISELIEVSPARVSKIIADVRAKLGQKNRLEQKN